MVELEIEGKQYKSNVRMNALDQALLSKRLVPIIGVIIQVSRSGANAPNADMLAMMIDSFSKLSDDDCVYIFDMCLRGVQFERDGVWAHVWNRSARKPQFDDFPLPTMLQLTYSVIMDALGSFILAPPAPLNGEASPN